MSAERLFCHGCEEERPVTQNTDGTYLCQPLKHSIICADCGALYTDNCGPDSVFVPAVTPDEKEELREIIRKMFPVMESGMSRGINGAWDGRQWASRRLTPDQSNLLKKVLGD